MNKILVLALMLFSVLSSYAQTKQYKITGGITGYEKGDIVLIDTYRNTEINRAEVKDNKFFMEGTLDETTEVLIKLDCFRGPREVFYLYGDNIKIEMTTMTRTRQARTVVKGGKENKVLRKFDKLLKKTQKARNKVRKDKNLTKDEKENLISELKEQYNEDYFRYIRKYKDHIVSVCKLKKLMKKFPLDKIEEEYNNFSEEVKASFYGKALEQAINTKKNLKPGNAAPNFTLKDKDGNDVTLYDISAEIKIVDFWASWCMPCIAEMHKMIPLYEKYKDKGLEIISVSIDSKKMLGNWRNMIKTKPWIQLHTVGNEGKVIRAYDISSIPRVIVLDKNNMILGEWRGAELKEKIEELLK